MLPPLEALCVEAEALGQLFLALGLLAMGVPANASSLDHKPFQNLKSSSTMAWGEASLVPKHLVMISGVSSVRFKYAYTAPPCPPVVQCLRFHCSHDASLSFLLASSW